MAKARGTTTRSLVELALQRLLDEATVPARFVLEDGSVGGGWLRPEFENAGWDQLRDEIYPMPASRLDEDA